MREVLTLAFLLSSTQEAEWKGRVRSAVRVERVLVDAYVTTGSGEPVPDLTAADFRVKVAGKPVELESVEWVPADRPEVVPLAPAGSGEAEDGPAPLAWPPGRVIVVFVQEDSSSQRQKGLMRMGQHLDPFLSTLVPTDRVAVVSFDSHLKLRRDFTADPKEIRAAFFESFWFDEPPPLPVGPFPSLARYLDFRAAKRAATVDKGLALVARVNVFTLDISDADYPTLEVRLIEVADLTGGRYEKTHIFTGGALSRVARSLGGRYVLVFVKPEGARGIHPLSVQLAGRKGEVVARPYYQD